MAHFPVILLTILACFEAFAQQLPLPGPCATGAAGVTGRNKILQITQETTRSNQITLSQESFSRDEIDFKEMDHISIHTEGSKVSGSQFSSDFIPNSKEAIERIRAMLPQRIHYDEFNRAEIVIETDAPVGYSRIASKAALENKIPGAVAHIQVRQRMPGGVPGETGGIKGAWFPEMERDASGKWVIKLGADGKPANPHFKFEPDANIYIGSDGVPTHQFTVVIEKDKKTLKPTLVTAFPGENAPPFPADIKEYQVHTLGPDSIPTKFWKDHVFLQPGKPVLNGLPLEPLSEQSRQRLINAKFTVSPYQTFIFPMRSPEEVLHHPDIKAALELLSSITKDIKEPTAKTLDRLGSNVVSVPIRKDIVAQLKKHGVTAELSVDSEGYKLRLNLEKPGEVIGYSGLVDNTNILWDHPLRPSPSGFTATPTVPGSPKPTEKLTVILAVNQTPSGQKLMLRDMFAGDYAPSGPPAEVADVYYNGKGLPDAKPPAPNDMGARTKRHKQRQEAVRKKMDADFAAAATDRERLLAQGVSKEELRKEIFRRLNSPDKGGLTAPGYAHAWDRAEVENSLKFWENHSIADGARIDPQALLNGKTPGAVATLANGLPRPVLAKELNAALAQSNGKRFMGEDGYRHVMQAEFSPEEKVAADGSKNVQLELQGGHSPEILHSILKYGNAAIQSHGNGNGLKYRLAEEGNYTVDGKAKAKRADGKTNLTGVLPKNPDGTFTLSFEMLNPEGTWVKKASPTTFFPEGYTEKHIDAVARVLAHTTPDQVLANGKKSFFGLFPSDPNDPNSPPFSVWLIMRGDEVVTVFPTGGRLPTALRE